ncbi:P-II family nitrogen regulator [Vallitalea okinawensis]|uniref:P-II family nitrogen regulator n=1 Tax=Vallitalea okinawensis TaxID=2078660 RepID=UPI002E8E122B|nr:P-II family nitrogen regulator [Vallitalea okinawensis]
MDTLTKIDIITRPSKYDDLKEALNEIGITGMTITHVLGCGMQKGIKETYRGIPLEINLIPKIKFEIVVCEVPVEKVVETARKVLYTGEVGDGKIFIYPVQNVIKIRTGEEGVKAL